MAYILDNSLQDFLPCPFCGKDPALEEEIRYPRPECEPKKTYAVVCNTHGCPIRHADNTYFFTRQEAVAKWNERKTGA